MAVEVRPERRGDAQSVWNVHAAAFETQAEAKLVDRLRSDGSLVVSLVAERAGRVVGHVAFSPVTVEGEDRGGVGLAPIAVVPDVQRQGVGKRLVREGLEASRRAGFRFVVVLGEPAYYRPLGFRTASASGFANDYGVDEPFMIQPLQGNELPPGGGLVRYGPAFDELGEG